MMNSLWGDDFVVKSEPQQVKKAIKKINQPKDANKTVEQALKSKKTTIYERLSLIKENVNKILGRYALNTQIIKSKEEYISYIDKAIQNGVIAVDTETNNSLEPLTCKIMGLCLYTPGQKAAYIPINHKDVDTDERFSWQLTEQEIADELLRLSDAKIIMHNGKFDYEVIKCTTGVQLKIFWDTLIGAKVLDENERSAGLKQQYIEKIDNTIEKYSIEHLFKDVEYAYVEPEIFALYAATDSLMTYKLYEWQKEQFEIKDNERIYNLFLNIEMPIVEVAAEMELTGVEVDQEYSKRLSAKYHKQLTDIENRINAELLNYEPQVNQWRLTKEANEHPPKSRGEGFGKSKSEQLESPVNISSPTQLAIFLYDVLGTKVIDKKAPRGTGEDILKKIDLPICSLILEHRGVTKLLNTYIDSIPTLVTAKTGRVHTHFNQYGAATGRFSSSDPINLQNIPSHSKDVRLMFKAKDGYAFVGSDYSQQEPRLLAVMSGDESMKESYRQGKDLYATMGVGVYKNDYWDNMEFRQDGSANPDGKKRRSNMKVLLLGMMYQMGPHSIATSLKLSLEEAQKIIDDFYDGFPKVKNWITKTQEDCRKLGYVEDFWGRRRRLPDILLPKYEIIDSNDKGNTTFNPIFGCLGKYKTEDNPKITKYKSLIEGVKNKRDVDNIKSQAMKDGITIHDNGGYIAQAERQCVNARIQGGAATLTKLAMIKIYRDEKLKELGFKLSIAVHDELIGECPVEHSEECSKRVCELMISAAAESGVDVPMKCDPSVISNWYEDELTNEIYKDICQYIHKEGMDILQAKNKSLKQHEELSPEQFEYLLNKYYGDKVNSIA